VIFKNLDLGKKSQVRPLALNFTIVVLEMWSVENRQNMEFCGKNLSQRGPIPLSDFYKIWRGRGRPWSARSHPHAKHHYCGFKNVGFVPPKSPKSVICGINLPKWIYPLQRF